MMPEYMLHVLNWPWEADSPEEAVRQALERGTECLVWTVTDEEVAIVPAGEVYVTESGLTRTKGGGDTILRFGVREDVDTEEWDDDGESVTANKYEWIPMAGGDEQC